MDAASSIVIRDALATDIDGILALQRANLKNNLSESEQEQWGFLSVPSQESDFERYRREAVLVVAIQGGRVVGFENTMTIPHALQTPLFVTEVDAYKRIPYNGTTIFRLNPCIIGQLAVDREFRGHGVAVDLHNAVIERSRGRFGVLVSVVESTNARSLAFHERKIHMKRVGEYEHESATFVVLAQDFVNDDAWCIAVIVQAT